MSKSFPRTVSIAPPRRHLNDRPLEDQFWGGGLGAKRSVAGLGMSSEPTISNRAERHTRHENTAANPGIVVKVGGRVSTISILREL